MSQLRRAFEAILGSPEEIFDFSVEELGWILLSHIKSSSESITPNLHLEFESIFDAPLHTGKPTNRELKIKVARTLSEAFNWLISSGLIALYYQNSYPICFVTRKGWEVDSDDQFQSFLRTRDLPWSALHPLIQEHAWSLYVRGDFGTAIFAAFKQVEVRVRETGRFSATDYGTDLMRSAFKVPDGPLTDRSLPKAEQEAMGHLFAGSIGMFKNPNSHRNVDLDEAAQAAESIMLASHLLRIVDRRETALK